MRSLPALLLLCFPALAADQWVRLTTPHFELYTTEGEKRGREAILYFEQVRNFFVQASPVKHGVTEFPVRIIGFRSEKQYRPYTINSASAAYYTQSRNRDYIVMEDLEPDHMRTAIHEYMHLVVNHSGLKIQPWIDEGWAEVYSTLKQLGRKTMIGDLIPGDMQVLQQQKWLSFEQLTSVDHNSPIYNERDRATIFYAESWAFVHMLYFAPDYRPKFAAFIAAIHGGKSAAAACEAAYGKTSAQVFADLQGYFRRNRLFAGVFEVKLSKSEEEAEVSDVSDFDSQLVLADLLATLNRRAGAQAAYEKLATEAPDKPEIPESMGYLAWQNGDKDSARKYFEKAYAAGSKDPQMCFHLGALELEAGKPAKEAIPALWRAVNLKPDYTEARMQLGFAELNAKNYPAAVAVLGQITNIDAEKAPSLFNALAYAEAQTGDAAKARKYAEDAKKWARTDADRQRTENLLRFLDSREQSRAQPTSPRPAALVQPVQSTTAPDDDPRPSLRHRSERVEGIAKRLDCEGKGARLTIVADDKPLVFDIPDPTHVELIHDGDGTFNFTCGPQKPFHIAVEYLPAPGANKVAGTVVRLQF